MKFSEQVRRQAAAFVSAKGQEILGSRRIPEADVGRAWMTVNEIETGYMNDRYALQKLKELQKACAKDRDLKTFWSNNAQELEAMLVAENV